ncbi:copper homeostasis protein CutC [Devosia sp. PTR5]|uniref:PF03932 family protein CutC n=1 Tax=Devosia oryzisoli TaxID=2774138 RepID=A0A927IT97_9HYPH|nr:copper homeostasis protein CutC [Devosia oryzisoli]MBD8065657.1 copper homeostasis protein CutC [Devosia oryzisoli]
MTRPLLEICVDDADGLGAAIDGGADRIELCAALELGGLTPSPGLVSLAGAAGVPSRAMIRHRPGDFVFSPLEADAMLGDIDMALESGLGGVVLGASLEDGRLDRRLLERLCGRAGGLGRTLHRAFDLVPDFRDAVEMAVDLGFDTILTSGGMPTCLEGLDNLTRVVDYAAGRITIMPGSGLAPQIIGVLRRTLPLSAVHGSASVLADPSSPAAERLGFSSQTRRRTSARNVAALRAALDAPN